ncbi:MAG: endonuclease domain-containing protein [Candidatus Baldrarchaeia archaeon]
MMHRGEKYLTSLERKVKNILDKIGVKYVSQFPTRTGFIIDFAVFINGRKIAIEVDGEKWHSSKEAKKRDRFKDYQLTREGWKVIRIKEQQIKSNVLERYLVKVLVNH